MTKEEAEKEWLDLHKLVKNWREKDPWHLAVYERAYWLSSYFLCSNGNDPGPWEMPPVPEGVEP